MVRYGSVCGALCAVKQPAKPVLRCRPCLPGAGVRTLRGYSFELSALRLAPSAPHDFIGGIGVTLRVLDALYRGALMEPWALGRRCSISAGSPELGVPTITCDR
jgi:hypothetical protein